MTDEPLRIEANVDDKISITFENGDHITGTVTVYPIHNMVRMQTLFGGDTYISLHHAVSYELLEARVETVPEPEGEGNLFGALTDPETGKNVIVYRDDNGKWNYKGKTVSWARAVDNARDELHLFNEAPLDFILR